MERTTQRGRPRRGAPPPAERVRPAVWLLCGVALVGLAAALATTLSRWPSPQETRVAAPVVRSGAPYAPPVSMSAPVPARVAEAAPTLEPPPSSPLAANAVAAPPTAPPENTALDAEAAQLASRLPPLEPGLPPVVAEALAPPSITGSPEAQLRAEADETLVQYMLDGTFEGQVYPWGFPIGDVVRQQRSLVASLSPEQRAEQLALAVRFWKPRRAVPRFTDPATGGEIWEGGGIDRWLLQGSTESPR